MKLILAQAGLRTAGVLVREGVSGGAVPCIQVLEIGTINNKRHPSDILPFLPKMRYFFQQLPPNAPSMHLKSCKIPITDLECVTNTLVKLGGPIWYLNIKKGTSQKFLSRELY